MTSYRGVSIALVFAAHSLVPAAASEAPRETDEARASKEFREYAQRTAAAYEIRVGTDDEKAATMHKQPLLRWTNPVGGRVVGHGELFLWTAGGRPAAALALYRYRNAAGRLVEHHEFCSLVSSGLTAVNSSGRRWVPKEAGVAFAPVPDAPEPHENSRLRLSQMRKLAARFKADKTTRQNVRRELRLLTQPMHRYEGRHRGVLDGALFAFIEATDPEVFLMIEARSSRDGHAWHYAFARMNSVRVRGFHGERLVWEAPELRWREVLNRPDKTYTALTMKVERP